MRGLGWPGALFRRHRAATGRVASCTNSGSLGCSAAHHSGRTCGGGAGLRALYKEQRRTGDCALLWPRRVPGPLSGLWVARPPHPECGTLVRESASSAMQSCSPNEGWRPREAPPSFQHAARARRLSCVPSRRRTIAPQGTRTSPVTYMRRATGRHGITHRLGIPVLALTTGSPGRSPL